MRVQSTRHKVTGSQIADVQHREGENFMKHLLLGLLLASMLGIRASHGASEPAITHLERTGSIIWTNAQSSLAYRIEWTSCPTSYWRSSWQNLATIETHTSEVGQASVPMFFRVIGSSNIPPAGMVMIDSGPFEMGDNYTNQWHFGSPYPVHELMVSLFYMDRYEIPRKQWNLVREWALTNGYTDIGTGFAPADNHPITQITWYEAVKWCNARSEKEGLMPVYYTDRDHLDVYRTDDIDLDAGMVNWSGNGYRLPTEAEWEKAARGGLSGHHYPWPSFGGDFSNHWDGSKGNAYNSGDPFDNGTTPIGYYNGTQAPDGSDMANQYGLYDMAGNVNEWCWDWHDDNYYALSPDQDPCGPDSSPYGRRSVRGGSWLGLSGGEDQRCSYRDHHGPHGSYDYNGFRCVRRP